MNLTSEQVHWIVGAVLIATAGLLLLRSLAVLTGRWPDYVVPVVLILFGIEFALDPLVHGTAVPAGYGAEMTQHFVMSGVLLAGSVGEFARLAKHRATLVWRLPFVGALAFTAVVFMLHAQHDAPASMLLLMTQHRMIGATLAGGALAALLTALPNAAQDERRSVALPLLILVLGVQLLVYTEGSVMLGGGQGH